MSSGIARVYSTNGGLVLPARTEYELQIVMEHAHAAARTAQGVRLSLNGHEWVVRNDALGGGDCARCGRLLAAVRFESRDGESVCAKCAQKKRAPRWRALAERTALRLVAQR